MSEINPMTFAGSNEPMTRGASAGVSNMKPVTLVATVVIKKSVLVAGMSLAPSILTTATMPLTMAIKLMITCSCVKLAKDIPRIIFNPPEPFEIGLPRGEITP
ncbi:MAG TPA: hypothetical protein VHU43_01090, partial [Steroidobacteraceae bacterium]|nr:hypothetical protein [Steroidobacteraceae bacterium]